MLVSVFQNFDLRQNDLPRPDWEKDFSHSSDSFDSFFDNDNTVDPFGNRRTDNEPEGMTVDVDQREEKG